MVTDFIQPITERRNNNIMKYNTSMTQISSEHPSTSKQDWQISVADRCDKCNAQAYVKIKGSTGELFFCGHHYEKIMKDPNAYTKMMSFMLEIIDEREKLIENKLIGGHNQ